MSSNVETGRASLPGWWNDEQDVQAALIESFEQGDFKMPVMFTIKRNTDKGYFDGEYVACVLLEGSKKPIEMPVQKSPIDAQIMVCREYGDDAQYVADFTFSEELYNRYQQD
jgi:hypothetical protein